MLREKVAKGAWHLSNIANLHSIHPSASTSELHPKMPPKVLRPRGFLARPSLNITRTVPSSRRWDNGVCGDHHRIWWSTICSQGELKKLPPASRLPYSRALTIVYGVSTTSRSICPSSRRMKLSNLPSKMMGRPLPRLLEKYETVAFIVWDSPLLLSKGLPRGDHFSRAGVQVVASLELAPS